MRLFALTLACLLGCSPVAHAQGFAPSAAPVSGGSVTLQSPQTQGGHTFPAGLTFDVPAGWYVTKDGWAQLGDRLTADAKRIAELQAINATLSQKIAEVSAQPGLTVKSIAILVGVGILIGGSTTLILKK